MLAGGKRLSLTEPTGETGELQSNSDEEGNGINKL